MPALANRHDSLLAHMLRCPEIFHAAYQKVDPQAFGSDFQHAHRVIWGAAVDIFRNYHVMPMETTLMAEATRRIDMYSPAGDAAMTAQDRQVVIELIQAIYILPEAQLLAKYATEQLNDLIIQSQIKPIVARMQHAPDTSSFSEAMNQLSTAYRASQISSLQETDIFSDVHMDGLQEDRIPTGATFFDTLLGGGIATGEVYGLLGGSGGGKTLASVHITCELALKGYHVNYFSYEQPVSGDLTRRFYACAGRININELKQPRQAWSEATKSKISELTKTFKPFFHVYDMSGRDAGFGGIDEVEHILRRDQHEGRLAALNIFDWMLVAIKRHMAVKNMQEERLRTEVQRYVDTCMRYGGEYGGAYLVVNQLAPGAVGSPGRLPKWTDSAEAKSFAWLMNSCFVLGQPSDKNILKIGVDKNRGNARGSLTAEMDPFTQRMIYRENLEWDNRNNRGFHDKNEDASVVPDEYGRKPQGYGRGMSTEDLATM